MGTTTPARRGPGRPPIAENEPSTYLQLTLPVSEYDRVYQMAVDERVSMQVIIRRALRALIDDDDANKNT